MPDFRLTACLAAIALAACSSEPGTEEPVAQDSAEAAEPASADPRPGTRDAFRFAGRWAESVEMCRADPWTITRERLTAPGGVACDLTRIEEAPGGYAIDARCTDGGETHDDRIVLRFAESAQALLVEGASALPETGLIRCGES